jgi:7tm Chemosensory receptor
MSEQLNYRSLQFMDMKVAVDYSRFIKIQLLRTLIVVSFNIPLSLIVYYYEDSVLKACLYLYSSLYFALSIILALSFIYGIRLRLGTMMSVLENLIVSFEVSPDDERDTRISAGLIDIYCDIIDVSDGINICFGFPSMLGYGLLFFHNLFTNFIGFRDFISLGTLTTTSRMSLMYAFYYSFVYTSVIFFAILNKRRARGVVRTINRLVKKTKSEQTTFNLLALSSLIMTNQPRFSCGLFEFDWKLTLATISAAVTNLVILIQFELASVKAKSGHQIAVSQR